MIPKTELVSGLRNLGIKSGDVVFLRVSYKSIGKTENEIIVSLLGEDYTFHRYCEDGKHWHREDEYYEYCYLSA